MNEESAKHVFWIKSDGSALSSKRKIVSLSSLNSTRASHERSSSGSFFPTQRNRENGHKERRKNLWTQKKMKTIKHSQTNKHSMMKKKSPERVEWESFCDESVAVKRRRKEVYGIVARDEARLIYNDQIKSSRSSFGENPLWSVLKSETPFNVEVFSSLRWKVSLKDKILLNDDYHSCLLFLDRN